MRNVIFGSAIALFALSATAADQAVIDRYNKTCKACHETGAAGAPKTGDADAWAPRVEKGIDALVQSSKQGLGAMPPKAMCYDCSDEDYAALIKHMAPQLGE